MQLITGKKGATHITSQQDADSNMALFGLRDYVLPIGGRLIHTIVSNNLITLSDGQVMFQGRKASVDFGKTENIIIDNGTQGQTRNDVIVVKYQRDPDTKYEDASISVIKGVNEEGDPVLTQGVIREGAPIHEMPLLRIRLNGINIAGVDVLYRIWGDPIPLTIPAAAWSNGLATLTNADLGMAIPPPHESELYPDESPDMTAAQLTAYRAANIWWESQQAGQLVLKAMTGAPTIDLPIIIKAERFAAV